MKQNWIFKRKNYLLNNKFIHLGIQEFCIIKTIRLIISNNSFENKNKMLYSIVILNKLNRKSPKFITKINKKDNILFNVEKNFNLLDLSFVISLLRNKSKIFDFNLKKLVTNNNSIFRMNVNGCLIDDFLYFKETFWINFLLKDCRKEEIRYLLSTL